jgi:hypothetical protein
MAYPKLFCAINQNANEPGIATSAVETAALLSDELRVPVAKLTK